MHKHETLAIATKKLTVGISLSNGASLSGKICVPDQGRLTDVLNDDRGFVPVECTDGSFVALSKQAIERITLPSAEAEAGAFRGSDPGLVWIILTDTQNRPIYVNMDHAISLKRTTSERKRTTTERTAIGFIGAENEPLAVLETPEQILALISAAKQQYVPHVQLQGSDTPPSYGRDGDVGTSALSRSTQSRAFSVGDTLSHGPDSGSCRRSASIG